MHIKPGDVVARSVEEKCAEIIKKEQFAGDLLKRPNVDIQSLIIALDIAPENYADDVLEQVETQARYAGYVTRQRDEIERQRKQEETALPLTIDYAQVRGLSNEVRQKLSEHRPETIGQASRIQGMTPAAVSLLLVHLKKTGGGERLRA